VWIDQETEKRPGPIRAVEPFKKLERVRNNSFLSRTLKLYSEIALSRKPFRIGYMYIYTFLLRMTDTMISQNIGLSSLDTLYKFLAAHVPGEGQG
jgi:hypothetical protein